MKAHDTLWGYRAGDQWDGNFTRLYRTSCDYLFSLRREGRMLSAEPVCSCALLCAQLHARPRVQHAPGLPCALCSLREKLMQTSGAMRRENAKSYSVVIARDRATQYSRGSSD